MITSTVSPGDLGAGERVLMRHDPDGFPAHARYQAGVLDRLYRAGPREPMTSGTVVVGGGGRDDTTMFTDEPICAAVPAAG
jgi:hypothetical protein